MGELADRAVGGELRAGVRRIRACDTHGRRLRLHESARLHDRGQLGPCSARNQLHHLGIDDIGDERVLRRRHGRHGQLLDVSRPRHRQLLVRGLRCHRRQLDERELERHGQANHPRRGL